jgi:formiminotetrahydrofolate cyclodeaminase
MEIFLKVLDPLDTSTGGGSASAISGAMAGSLIAMVARLSVRDQEVGAEQEIIDRIFFKSKQLSQILMEGSQEDAQAFQLIRNAYQLARQTEAEKKLRQQAIQSAWQKATRVPLENAEHCMQVYGLGTELVRHANPKAISDLRCGLLLAHAGFFGCLENVNINLPSIKEAPIAAEIIDKANDLRRQFKSIQLSHDSLSTDV